MRPWGGPLGPLDGPRTNMGLAEDGHGSVGSWPYRLGAENDLEEKFAKFAPWSLVYLTAV